MLFASSSSNVSAGVEDDDVVAVLGDGLACLGGGGGGGGEVDPSPLRSLDGMDFTLPLQTLPPNPSGESLSPSGQAVIRSFAPVAVLTPLP